MTDPKDDEKAVDARKGDMLRSPDQQEKSMEQKQQHANEKERDTMRSPDRQKTTGDDK